MENILIAVLGGGNLILFIKFLIERYDKKEEKKEFNIKDELLKLKKDGIRTQMLVLILLKPDEKKEILTLGEHYFKKLEGDWYMTSIFNKWINENLDGVKPEWFDSND